MSTEEDREALAAELRKVYMRTPGNRGMDAPRWVAVADAAIAALHHPEQDDYEAGYAEGFHDGLSTPRGTAEYDRTPAPAPADSPPVYLALDLWMALGMPSKGFDGYYERNGWADTWSNLLGAVRRQSGRKECPIIAAGERCVLINGHIGPHMGASDVGSSEPLPLVEAAVSTPQDTEWEYVCNNDEYRRFTDSLESARRWEDRGYTIRRRRAPSPAGPWEPVPTEGVSE